MKMKSILALLLAMFAVSSLFAGCSKGGNDESGQSSQSESAASEDATTSEESAEAVDERLVGTWYTEGYSLMLDEDGTGVYGHGSELVEITWLAENGTLTISGKEGVELPTLGAYVFTEDGESFTVGEVAFGKEPVEPSVPVDSALVGTWYSYDAAGESSLVLNADGTGSENNYGVVTSEITWTVVDGVFKMTTNLLGYEYTITFDSYKLEGDTLTMSAIGETKSYTKTKKPLGGDSALCGGWAEKDAELDEYGTPVGIYLSLSSDGTANYTDAEGETYTMLWAAADGTLTFDVYGYDDDFNSVHKGAYTCSYSIDGESLSFEMDGKESTLELFTEEIVYEPEFEVDLDHALGGDEALCGTWIFDDNADKIVIAIKEDGTVEIEAEGDGQFGFPADGKWYTEDGFVVCYVEVFGETMPMLYGHYALGEGYMDVSFPDGTYVRMVTQNSAYAPLGLYLEYADSSVTDHELLYIIGEKTGAEWFTLGSDFDLASFKYLSIEYTADGEMRLGEVLYSADTLSSEKYFASAMPATEGLAFRAISFVDGNGNTLTFAIAYNGYSGGLDLVPIEA